MKSFLVIASFVLIPALSQAAAPQTNICEDEAWKVVEPYFDQLVASATAIQKANLQPGEELNEDALPFGLDISQSFDEQIDFGWGENEECSCGVSVKTEKAKDGKSCKVELDEASYGCDCG